MLTKVHLVKAVHCHIAYLTSMQSTSHKMLEWMKHKLESRLQGEISVTSYADDTTLMAKVKRTTEPLYESKRGE